MSTRSQLRGDATFNDGEPAACYPFVTCEDIKAHHKGNLRQEIALDLGIGKVVHAPERTPCHRERGFPSKS
eukprot:4198486-Prymnesium_polylepis.1